jgi:peroxiredoxin Q/BCP
MFEISDPAPDFTLPRDGAPDVSLSKLRGSPVVVYFYPRDNTPGCTNESKDFSALSEAFTTLGAHVFGISADDLPSHARFVAKHGLRVTLLSDTETTTCQAYGVWKEKNMYGKKFMGIERSSFLIDGDGNIAAQWRRVKVPGHAEAVLAAVRAL